ncbi:MAG: OmpH family outer membrane protein [Chromatiales bacterium]|nr:OmpH family outer membrane protein [Gammaproteobacteria bacterium]MCP5352834.1 OmpH family outer membrane protein [Chromatiales bacterium]
MTFPRLPVVRALLLAGLVALAPVAHADLKIGFVHAAQLLEKAPQAQQASEMLDKEFETREQELVESQRNLKKLEERLLRDGSVLEETDRVKLEREIVAHRREIKRAQDDFREDFNLRRNQELTKLQKLIRRVILDLAKSEKFDLIVSDGVVYASDAVNITDLILEKLGERSLEQP